MGFQLNFTNIHGLHSNLNAVHFFLESNQETSLLALTETQIGTPEDVRYLTYPGYTLFHLFRKKAGVCVYLKSSLSGCEVSSLNRDHKDFQILCVRISMCQHQKVTFCCYRSPNSCPASNKIFFKTLYEIHSEASRLYPNSEIIFLGDFNVHN